MSRKQIVMAAALAVFAVGTAGLFGLLIGLQNDQEYHPIAIIAVVVFMVCHPLLNRALAKSEATSSSSLSEDRVEELVSRLGDPANAAFHELIRSGHKIEAIRLLRAESAATLCDAKKAVEWMMARRM